MWRSLVPAGRKNVALLSDFHFSCKCSETSSHTLTAIRVWASMHNGGKICQAWFSGKSGEKHKTVNAFGKQLTVDKTQTFLAFFDLRAVDFLSVASCFALQPYKNGSNTSLRNVDEIISDSTVSQFFATENSLLGKRFIKLRISNMQPFLYFRSLDKYFFGHFVMKVKLSL
jgi:hypothetical protein